MYKLINKKNYVSYFVNSNTTILYIYDKQKKEIIEYYRDKWTSMKLEVIECIKQNETKKEVDLKTIIESENDFIEICQIISSTTEKVGYFQKVDNFGIKTNYLNIFLGSETFRTSLNNNKFKNKKTIELLKKETPTINLLLRNLFYKEKDDILLNFLNWLNVVSFQNKNQNIIWSFIGTNEENQGQGAGKGILIQLLSKMFKGLVCSVSNTSYLNNFNSILMNKKIVVFDEVNYKSLKYEKIKDITGNNSITIEYKGKEPIIVDNVSSWLFFSNEYDLCNKITIEDRRTFIIRPNPVNGSLEQLIKTNFIDFDSFLNKLYSEIDNFIHIISYIGQNRKIKVLTPLELSSNGHRTYFKEQMKVSVNDLDKLYRIFTNKQFKTKLLSILEEIKQLETIYIENIEIIKNMLEIDCINYKTFEKLFYTLKNMEYIKSSLKINKEWEIFKENLLKNGFIIQNIVGRETKKYKRFRDKILIEPQNYKNNKTKLINKIKTIYCVKKDEIE